MSIVSEETFRRIEETQGALRDRIGKTKQLASLSERLIRRHRYELIEAQLPHLTS